MSKVLRYHQSLGLNESLSFKNLTKMLASVLAKRFLSGAAPLGLSGAPLSSRKPFCTAPLGYFLLHHLV